MKRRHLFEFEDYKWFPAFIRDGGTDFIGFVLHKIKFYNPSIPLLKDALVKTNTATIVDLCSGSGQQMVLLSERLGHDKNFILTDKFPNKPAFKYLKSIQKLNIDVINSPTDVLKPEKLPDGLRTMYTAIHHFTEEQVILILKQAINQNQPIGIFDGASRAVTSILAIILLHPLLFLLCTPFIRPFSFNRLFFTYIIPLIPLYAIWDGIVSVLRLHSPEELLSYALRADTNNTYEWKVGSIPTTAGFSMGYLTGIPRIKPN